MGFDLLSSFSALRASSGTRTSAPGATDVAASPPAIDSLPHGRCVLTPRPAANEPLPADAAPRIDATPWRPRSMHEWLT